MKKRKSTHIYATIVTRHDSLAVFYVHTATAAKTRAGTALESAADDTIIHSVCFSKHTEFDRRERVSEITPRTQSKIDMGLYCLPTVAYKAQVQLSRESSPLSIKISLAPLMNGVPRIARREFEKREKYNLINILSTLHSKLHDRCALCREKLTQI